MAAPVILVLGAGARVGQSTAHVFKAAGYRVAIASRSLEHLKTNSDGFLELRVDLADPSNIPSIFEAVEKTLGQYPSVVVYNGASGSFLPPDDPLAKVELTDLIRDTNVNFVSPLLAAKHAVAGFDRLPETASRTFIYTGNLLNVLPGPAAVTFGAGKAASASAIEALSKGYNGKGYRFYYADERWDDGASPLNEIDGPAHGKEYLELARDPRQRPWDYTFVKRIGYKAFTPRDAENTRW